MGGPPCIAQMVEPTRREFNIRNVEIRLQVFDYEKVLFAYSLGCSNDRFCLCYLQPYSVDSNSYDVFTTDKTKYSNTDRTHF